VMGFFWSYRQLYPVPERSYVTLPARTTTGSSTSRGSGEL
jgi:hypothetical protein